MATSRKCGVHVPDSRCHGIWIHLAITFSSRKKRVRFCTSIISSRIMLSHIFVHICPVLTLTTASSAVASNTLPSICYSIPRIHFGEPISSSPHNAPSRLVYGLVFRLPLSRPYPRTGAEMCRPR
ncbi:hypothetical protein BDW66DRAFT_101983 [Aspergillus desertorum]